VKIANLFNYANRHWTRVVEKVAFRGLGEELELYELVELDADGKVEPSDKVDGMTGGNSRCLIMYLRDQWDALLNDVLLIHWE